MERRVIIAGSREFTDYDMAESAIKDILGTLDELHIVSGHCRGADILGERFAAKHGLKLSIFPAKWGKYGKRAGYIRNSEMAEFASTKGYEGILIAFWDGTSRGTGMMINLARRKGLKVHIVKTK